MAISKAFYFLVFGALACLVPFFTLHYQDIGLSGREIGFLSGIVPLVSLAGSTIWSMVSDATGRHRLLFLMAITGTWTAVFLITRVDTFILLVPIVIAYAFCFSPILPLADNAVLDWLGQDEYGRQRVWGSYGWGVGGAFAGIIIAAYGLPWAFISFLIIFILLFLVATRLPMSPAAAGGAFWQELRQLLANRAWLLFLAVAMTEAMALNIILNYLFLYLETLNTSPVIMGLTLTAATISEIPIFLYSQRFLKRWSPPFLMAVSILFTALRAFGYIGMTAPWQVLLVSLLHGPTFALMWIAGVAYAAKIAPPGLGATAQGVFSGLVMGLGSALGAFAGGWLYDAYGPLSMFYFAGITSLIAAAVFIIINRTDFYHQLKPARP